jgi:hypothetical protein
MGVAFGIGQTVVSQLLILGPGGAPAPPGCSCMRRMNPQAPRPVPLFARSATAPLKEDEVGG